MDSAKGGNLMPCFGNWSQSENLSEIKPPSIDKKGHHMTLS